MEKEVDMNEKC